MSLNLFSYPQLYPKYTLEDIFSDQRYAYLKALVCQIPLYKDCWHFTLLPSHPSIWLYTLTNNEHYIIFLSLCQSDIPQRGVSFLFGFLLFIYFLATLGLCFCAKAFSSCWERGLLFVAVQGLLIAVASLVAEHGL